MVSHVPTRGRRPADAAARAAPAQARPEAGGPEVHGLPADVCPRCGGPSPDYYRDDRGVCFDCRLAARPPRRTDCEPDEGETRPTVTAGQPVPRPLRIGRHNRRKA